jgi:hypothetical protein
MPIPFTENRSTYQKYEEELAKSLKEAKKNLDSASYDAEIVVNSYVSKRLSQMSDEIQSLLKQLWD